MFAKSFAQNLRKNTGLVLDEDGAAYIKSVCENTEPYRKIDNKGRHSEYFTFRMDDLLLTVVCDGITKKIVTAVIETHRRPQFNNA